MAQAVAEQVPLNLDPPKQSEKMIQSIRCLICFLVCLFPAMAVRGGRFLAEGVPGHPHAVF